MEESPRYTCNCNEGKTQRTTGYENNDPRRRLFEEKFTPTGLYKHDCAYIAKRDAVLNQAERIALNETLPNAEGKRVRHGPGWQQAFSQAVNELSARKE